MEEWKEYKLEETTDFVAGFAFKSKHFGIYKDKVVNIKDIQPPIVSLESTEGVDLSKYDKVKLNKYIVKQNDFLLAMTGATIGKIGKYMNDKPTLTLFIIACFLLISKDISIIILIVILHNLI